MNKQLIDTFGDLVSRQVPEHPGRARRLLAAAYSFVSWQTKYLPDKGIPRSRSYINSVTTRLMADSLTKPERCAVVNVFLPCEMLHAMDLVPMFPEALACYMAGTACEHPFVEAAEERDVPESYCSYHKILLGLAETGVLPRPLLAANTTLACDANVLSFRRLAKWYGIPHMSIDVPASTGEDAVDYVAQQLRGLSRLIEETAGQKLDVERLKETVARSRRTVEYYRRYLRLRQTRSVSDIMTSELFSLVATHVLLGTKESEKYAKDLVLDLERLPQGFRGKRILWIHILPSWQESMASIFNTNERCEIVASDITLDGLVDLDPQKPYESMARRVVSGLCNGGADRRIAANLEYAKQLNAHGIILFCHWGCKQTLGMSALAKREFEAAGYPTLILDGDGCDSRNVSDGQMVTRVNAFIEQLEGLEGIE